MRDRCESREAYASNRTIDMFAVISIVQQLGREAAGNMYSLDEVICSLCKLETELEDKFVARSEIKDSNLAVNIFFIVFFSPSCKNELLQT